MVEQKYPLYKVDKGRLNGEGDKGFGDSPKTQRRC